MARKYLWCMVLILLVLVGCSGDEDSAQVSGAGRSEPSNSSSQGQGNETEVEGDGGNLQESSDSIALANLPRPIPDEFVLPELDIPYPIAFSHDQMLYVVRFDAEPATLLTDTLEFTIKVKDASQVIYVGVGSESPTSVFSRYSSIYIYDTETESLLNEILLADDDHFADIESWSPNGQWTVVRRFEDDDSFTDIYAIDGAEPIETLTPVVVTAWLTDNTVLFYEVDDENNIANVLRYNPATDEYLDIDLDMSQVSTENTFFENYSLISEQLAVNDLELVRTHDQIGQTVVDTTSNTYVTIVQPEAMSSTTVCEDWIVQRGGREIATSTLFDVEDTHALTDLHQLPDGSIIFLRWFKDECDFSEALQAEIIRVFEDGTSEVVARDLYVNVQNMFFSNNNFRVVEPRMDISADGQYLLWISQAEPTRGDVALNLKDLTSGESAVLLVTPEADGTLFRTVQWID